MKRLQGELGEANGANGMMKGLLPCQGDRSGVKAQGWRGVIPNPVSSTAVGARLYYIKRLGVLSGKKWVSLPVVLNFLLVSPVGSTTMILSVQGVQTTQCARFSLPREEGGWTQNSRRSKQLPRADSLTPSALVHIYH